MSTSYCASHGNIIISNFTYRYISPVSLAHKQKYFKFQNLQIETVVDQDQVLSHAVGYQELVTMSHINCKVTSSVMCRAKYKSDPGWDVGWVLARNLNLRDTLVPNVCRVCTWYYMEYQLVAIEQTLLINWSCKIKVDVWLNIAGCFPIPLVLHYPGGRCDPLETNCLLLSHKLLPDGFSFYCLLPIFPMVTTSFL